MTSRISRFALPTLAAGALGLSLLVAPGATAAPVAAPTRGAVEQERTAPASDRIDQLKRPLVFGHRGASGYRPEHTLASYELAIKLGADYVEPDLVPTKDGVLVARHENDITGTTDVAEHPEFADRKTTKTIDGKPITGWFTEDFTLAELKTLRAVERLPDVRPDNTRYDGRFQVPTFAQVLRLVKQSERKYHRTIGVAPETKHPTYFDSIGLSTEEPMLRTLRKFHLDKKKSRVIIQSFEVRNLKQLDRQTDLPLEQLVDATGGPFDQTRKGLTYADMVTADGLRDISRYADWVGPNKDLVLARTPEGAVAGSTRLVKRAHRVGLEVVVFTLRDENQFMATDFRRGDDPDYKGDIHAEVTAFLDAGVDGLFADYPDSAIDARDDWLD